MTRLAGPVRQIGVVVRDVDAAIRHFTDTLGIGPFVAFRQMHFDEGYRYRGESAEAPVVTIAIAHTGPLQIEIIQQHNQAPSAYRDFIEAGREGMQHLSPWCSSRDEYDATHVRLLNEGLEVVHEGRPKGMDVRFAYFSRPEGGWPQLEVSEGLLPEFRPIGKLLERLNNQWDGRDAVIDAADLPRLLRGEK